MQKSITLFLLFLFSISLSAQINLQFAENSPYKATWKKEVGLGLAGLGMLATGNILKQKTKVFTLEELALFNSSDINTFDRVATTYNSTSAHETSNYVWFGSHALPFLFLTNKKTRKDFIPIGGMYTEVLFVNAGATLLMKYAVKRPRPYVYDPTISDSLKMRSVAQASFVSGHTSMVAANSFFMATVFSDYFPDSKWKPLVWSGAVLLPAVTGYLRVRGGRHYPTDVIGGAVLGAAIGYFVPKLHRVKTLEQRGISLNAGLNSVGLVWKMK